MTEELCDEILLAFACPGDNQRLPSVELIKYLAQATGKYEDKVRERFTQLYRDQNDTDDDPFDPPMTMAG